MSSRHEPGEGGSNAGRLRLLLILGLAVVVSGVVLWVRLPRSNAGTPCRGATSVLAVTSSEEKAPLLSQLAREYMRTGPKAGGRCLQVDVHAKSSGATLRALAAGWSGNDGPRPDVWSPSSSAWTSMLQWRNQQAGRPDIVGGGHPSVTTTPLVVAMPRPMAVALGWPRTQASWLELLDLARSHASWARFGHPEWGTFKLGKANADLTGSGLDAVLATYTAATKRSDTLRTDDVRNLGVRRFVAGVEQAVAYSSDTISTVLSGLRRADDRGEALTYMSAIVADEHDVWAYNHGVVGTSGSQDGATPPKVPLVAVYPREGTLLADHPYAILSAPWVDDAKRVAASDFLAWLQRDDVQRNWQRAGFRNWQGVLGDQAQPESGLLPAQPQMIIDRPTPEVLELLVQRSAQLSKKANLLSVIDVSESMLDRVPGTGTTKIGLATRAAGSTLGLLTGDDRIGLWVFASTLRGGTDYRELVPLGPVRDPVNGVPRDRLFREQLAAVRAGNGTGLYDTTLAAFRTVHDNFQPGAVNAVLILSDGVNHDPRSIQLKELIDTLQDEQDERPVHIITIAYGADADRQVLEQIANVTSGASYNSADPRDIERIYSQAISNF
ncbi:MAG TPA: substrate-binding domain-containing protein [Actinomycetes bacterium]|nr:substrate-binding domain-containing protein [Actinomycetes bacterium]